MKKFNAEQIIKALECCISDKNICDNCPIQTECENNPFESTIHRYALKTIKSQEQKIFELKNRLKECENGYKGTNFLDRCKLHDAEEKINKLSQEIEQRIEDYSENQRKWEIVYDKLEEENEQLKEDKAELEAILDLRSKRKYYTKFVKEVFQKQEGKKLSYPDFDYIYKIYFELVEENKRMKENIIQPIKIGQTIYYIDEDIIKRSVSITPLKVFKTMIQIDKKKIHYHYVCIKNNRSIFHVPEEELNISAFITKKEAEKALYERKE